MPPTERTGQRAHSAESRRLLDVRAYALEHLSTERRRGGETYADHGEEVAAALQELTGDQELREVALLHDLPVHPAGTTLLKLSPLSDEQKRIVRGMHALRRLHIDENTKDLEAAVAAFTHDPRLVLLRMAHRLNDIRHIERFPPALRRRIARETLYMYTAIAGRLSLHKIRHELEDTCFLILHPAHARRLQKQFKSIASMDSSCLEQTKSFLMKHLHAEGIPPSIDFRIKGLYSTFRKMVLKKRSFTEVTDRLALRIIVPTLDECYRTLGVVHRVMHPIPGKLKDYIGAPKDNGYRSIHTVVYPLPGVTEQPMEIQIRTPEMHRENEVGFAAHADYKGFAKSLERAASRVNLLRNLEHLKIDTNQPERFIDALRTSFHEDRLLIFDPQNVIYHLVRPATALDFACFAYKERVAYLKTVRINGRERPFGTPLQDGDTVELKFSKTKLISREWLRGCEQSENRVLFKSLLEGI